MVRSELDRRQANLAEVLEGYGRVVVAFSGGADIKEFGAPEAFMGPSLWSLNSMLDESSKPVVAAIEGVALGGGFELALSCHHRVALSSAKVGLPEVKLGLLPGAGGTQRLPRIIGIEGAINVMLGGEPVPVGLFAKSPLFDAIVDADLITTACGVAEKSAAAVAAGQALRRIRDAKIRELWFHAADKDAEIVIPKD